jgi:kinesin family member 5
LRDVNSQRNNNRVFAFDDIFPPETLQPNIFEITSLGLTREVLQGYNGTVFAYGQTGSGKTYTMMGDVRGEEEKGLIPRCFESILSTAKSDTSKDYLIMCSYVELYN